MAKTLIVPIFIPHLGCKHACVFCNQKKIAGEYAVPTKDAIVTMVKEYRASAGCFEEIQLAFYGGSFTGLDNELRLSLLTIAKALKDEGLIDKIRFSTRPDYINQEIIEELKRYQVDIVELGAQSMDDEVLSASERGHCALQTQIAARLLKENHFTLGLQMMVALPKDTPIKALETAKKIIACEPDFVRIYPTAIIKDTHLAKMWQDGLYETWDWDVLLDTTAQIAGLFEEKNIPIIRIGLQASDNLTLEQDLLGGAYHPALGEMVKARMLRHKVEELLFGKLPGSYQVFCNDRQVSQVKGQKNCNIEYFSNKGYKLTITPQKTIMWNEVVLNKEEQK